MGFAVPYLPIAQQRKLVMGLHIPLCILAAIAISRLMTRLKPVYAVCLAAGVIMLTFQSNAQFLSLDMTLLSQRRTVTRYAPYMSVDQLRAMALVRKHTTRKDTILASPQVSLFLPAFADRQVYYGHWSETPDYESKLAEWFGSSSAVMPLRERLSALDATGADYVILNSPFQAELLIKSGRLRMIGGSGQVSVLKVLQ